MKSRKKLTKKSLHALDDIPFGDGTKLTEKEKKEMSQAITKLRAQRKGKKAA